MINLTKTLRRSGVSKRELAMLERAGELARVRRGAYDRQIESEWVARHRQLIEATMPQLRAPSVLSDASAAVWHGLPVVTTLPGGMRTGVDLTRVTVARPRTGLGGGQRSRHLVVRKAQAAELDVVDLGGIPTTSLPRTAVDVAAVSALAQGIAVVDAVLAQGVTREQLEGVVGRVGARHGAERMRRAIALGDGRAESPGESIARMLMMQAGFPTPELQYDVWHENRWLARVDFAWPELGIVGEFDGMSKYGLLPGGPEAAVAIMAEKERERGLQRAGWGMLRWIWSDLVPEAFHTVHLADFHRARLRSGR